MRSKPVRRQTRSPCSTVTLSFAKMSIKSSYPTICRPRILARERIGHVGLAVAQRRREHRRIAPRIEDVAAGVIERHREAEGAAFRHLGDTLLDLLRGHQIEPPKLVVGAEIAPGRAN